MMHSRICDSRKITGTMTKRRSNTKRECILRVHRANPNLTHAKVAEKCKASISYVDKVLGGKGTRPPEPNTPREPIVLPDHEREAPPTRQAATPAISGSKKSNLVTLRCLGYIGVVAGPISIV